VVRSLRDRGTTIILVEQSVNVALTVADTAYFMEKGEIRFHGPTADLLERPDVLRSVFFQGAAAGLEPASGTVAAEGNGAGSSAGTGNGNGHEPVVAVTAEPAPTANGAPVVSGSPASNGAPVVPEEGQGIGLTVADLSVSFGGIRAVDEVTFDVAPREVVGLIGPNGAGKTTLLDLISGFLRPDTGQVRLGGVDLTGAKPNRRAVLGLGRSFQDSRLFPSLTVEETLLVALERWLDSRDPFNAALRLPPFVVSEAAARHRVDELIELLGLEAFRSKFIGELSTGSRRVVDIGCVLAHAPSVVLLDEPSSGIAQREAEALGPLLLRIRELTGASVLVIEHDVPLLTDISDRLIALDLGRIITVGSPTDVINHPAVVASYLGESEVAVARSGPRSLLT
jgi:ABC-type branched-subunit amino acid transport system ATPase component